MKKEFLLPDNTRLLINANVTYHELTAAERQTLSVMKKDIGLAEIDLSEGQKHFAWHIVLDEETMAHVQTLLHARGICDIPFVLATGDIRFANIIFILDDEKVEYLATALITLVVAAIGYCLLCDDEALVKRKLKEIESDVVSGLMPNGTWDSAWIYSQAGLWIADLQHADNNVMA